MADIDGAIGMECYAAFALQQPLSLDDLAAAAERAELPIAAGAAADPTLVSGPLSAPHEAPVPSDDQVAAMLAAAPELEGTDLATGRRITD